VTWEKEMKQSTTWKRVLQLNWLSTGMLRASIALEHRPPGQRGRSFNWATGASSHARRVAKGVPEKEAEA